MGLLRFLFALSVIIHHSGSLFGFDLLGRDPAIRGFYVISGFYMGLILNTKYTQKRGYFLFLSNRALRIYPLYWVILGLTLIVAKIYALSGGNPAQFGIALHQSSLFLYTSLTAFIRDVTLIVRTDYLTPTQQQPLVIAQAYTLVIELLFYLVAPFIVRRKSKQLFLLFFLAVLFRIGTVALFRLVHQQYNERFFPAQLVFFILGAISYRFYEKIKSVSLSPLMTKSILLGIILITLSYQFTLWHWNIRIRWMDGSVWIYLVLLATALPFIFYATKTSKIDRMIGELSYPMYVSHVLIYALLSFTAVKNIAPSWFTLAVIGITILFSLALHHGIERPINHLRQVRFRKSLHVVTGSVSTNTNNPTNT